MRPAALQRWPSTVFECITHDPETQPFEPKHEKATINPFVETDESEGSKQIDAELVEYR